MDSQFKKFKVSRERFSAIYGKNLPKSFIKKAKKEHRLLKHYPSLNEGEIGLIKSYFKLWELISKQEEKFAVIFEDDALINEEFFDDLDELLLLITEHDFIDISGDKGTFKINGNSIIDLYNVPTLNTTGQIIGKNAALKLKNNLVEYKAPIDVMLQDVYKHKVKVFCTKKKYVSSNDINVGGTTIQKKDMLIIKKTIREIIRPFWQLIALLTHKTHRFIKNYMFYRSYNS